MNFKNIIIFLLGVGVGGASTYFAVRKKIEQQFEAQYQEDLESVKETFNNKADAETIKAAELAKAKPSMEELVEKYSPSKENDGDSIIEYISDEEFGNKGYARKELIYYEEDDVLFDTSLDEIINFEETLGLDALNHIGDYEENWIYVRDNYMRTDYEVEVHHSAYANLKPVDDDDDEEDYE